MKLLFELSGEDEILSKAEVFSSFDEYKVILDFKTALVLDLKQDEYTTKYKRKFQYLGLTKYVSEVLAITELDKDDIIKQAIKIKLDDEDKNKNLSLRVRCKKVEKSDKICLELERRVGRIFKNKGFKINLTNPDIEIRIILCKNKAIIGRKITSYEDLEKISYKDLPFFYPGIIKPKYSRVFVNLCALKEGEILLDPMCGTGSMLIEGILMNLKAIGSDIRKKVVKGAIQNLNFVSNIGRVLQPKYHFIVADSRYLPFKDKTIDGVVVDMPYGRSSPIFGKSMKELYQKSLEELYRVSRGRCVIVSRDNISDLAESIGFKRVGYYEQRVHGSLVRKILVVSPSL
ncbi:MAG: hypothetical protein EF806_02630 [Candidatus Methanoliparum thermophilum]|uniref:tRNA (guanine(10)-N(2))-dimethyltransferase n=1 Tax=Methanoliparum thermophilum TaxID=2491083 RepID=A0A520KSR5_METT2|nr:THUMP domain-containing protein [Candidatus Methanoliparum sp. LAM-1]RZN64956.1 MAG: hypothetical protein EF806_02630 [Candidatus Methanoliparum thermophilum]BDC36161.1 tRNA (guanine-N2)-dimethyltransferase [Candidatus Methanoliparum sp. LAM-1]